MTGTFKNKYRTDSVRLQGYDYSQAGYYFVTICTENKELFFGEIVGKDDDAEMELSEIGKVAEKFWVEIPKHFKNLELDEFVIMPNHVHGIIVIMEGDDGNTDDGSDTSVETRRGASLQQQDEYKNKFGPLQRNSLSSVINHFKGNVKRFCNQNKLEYFAWQPRFYDHVIRSEKSLINIREYIRNNPFRWELDRNNDEEKEIGNLLK